MTKSPTTAGLGAKLSPRQTFISFLSLVGFLVLLTACGSGPAPMSLTPNGSNLQSAQTLQFTAIVSDATKTPVRWTAGRGSVSSSGLYTAPSVTSQITDTVTATSMVDPTLQATASVVILAKAKEGNGQGVSVTVTPSSGSVQSGQSLQFTANVTGTSNTAVTWSASLGTVSASGLYTSPHVTTQTSDTISVIGVADPAKYAQAVVTVQAPTSGGGGGGGGGNPTTYTLTNQQPVNPVAFSLSSQNANSIMGKTLPSDVLNHLWGNTRTVTNSNLYGKCIITDCGNDPTGGAGSLWGSTSYSSYGNYDTTAFYWAKSSDPYWIVNGCSYCSSGWTSGPFHAPSNMLLPGGNSTGDSDAQLTVWDQATGMVVSVYGSPGSNGPTYAGTCPGTAGAGTLASPCILKGLGSAASAVSNFYTDRDWQSTNPSSQPNLASSLGLAPTAGMNRVNEFLAGAILHAEYDSTDCVSAPGGTKLPAVFPGTGTPGTLSCDAVGKQSPYRPQEGMLYFADYTDAQLACLDPAQAVCQYSDSTNIPKVEPFQMIFLTQLAHYGHYIGETSNASGSMAEYAGWHDDVATNWYQTNPSQPLASPFWAWAAGVQAASGPTYMNCFGPRAGTNPSLQTCTMSLYVNIPQMTGISGATDQSGNSCSAGHGCDLSGHIQVADACVAVAMAGLSSSGGVNACP